MKQRLRIGLLGTGVAAEKLYRPAFEQLQDCLELVACTNRTRSKAVAFARRAGFARVEKDAQALFDAPDVDAIVISLPIATMPRFVLAALAASKPVLSEKPVAGSVAEAKKLVKQAARFSQPWMIGENFAFMSHVIELEKSLVKGQLGDVRLVEARQINWMDRKNPYFNTSWRAHPEHVGGFVVDGGVHLAHVVRRCFGMPKVVGRNRASFNPQLPPFDTVVALLNFDSGAVGTWTSCFAARDSGPMLRVLGSKANAELFWDRLEVTPAKGPTRAILSKRDSFAAQFEHFADVILRGKALQMTPANGVLDLDLICRVCG